MTLSEDKVKTLIDKLNVDSKGGITCPVCGERLWGVNKTIMELREFNNGDIVIGGNSTMMPLVTLTCSKCGNTLFFNALRLGLIDNK